MKAGRPTDRSSDGRRNPRPAPPHPPRAGTDRRSERADPWGVHRARSGSDGRRLAAESPSTGKSNSPRCSRNTADSTSSWATRPGRETCRDQHYLEGGPFHLARGQYDSYELFIELGRRLLRNAGRVRLHRARQHHAAGTRAVAPHAVGEHHADPSGAGGRGAFPVCFAPRSSCALSTGPQSRTTRFAWPRSARNTASNWKADTLFDPVKTVAEIVVEEGHTCDQAVFAKNPRKEFEIPSKEADRDIVQTIDRDPMDWPSLTTTGRGVELGKKGLVLQCPYCYRWDTMPAKYKGQHQDKNCTHCGRDFALGAAAKTDTIVSKKREGATWRRLLVGESINRYFVSKRLWIDVSRGRNQLQG